MIDTSKIIHKILDQIVIYVFYGIGIFALIKSYLLLNGLRIYSFIRVYFNKKNFLKANIFYLLSDMIYFRNELTKIKDVPKKKLANIVIKEEINIIHSISYYILNKYINKNFKQYFTLQQYNNFTSDYIINDIIKKFTESRIELKRKLNKSIVEQKRMSHEDFERFFSVYEEYISIIEFFFIEPLRNLEEQKNVYSTLFNCFDLLKVYSEIINKTITHSISIMNGRISDIYLDGEKIVD